MQTVKYFPTNKYFRSRTVLQTQRPCARAPSQRAPQPTALQHAAAPTVSAAASSDAAPRTARHGQRPGGRTQGSAAAGGRAFGSQAAEAGVGFEPQPDETHCPSSQREPTAIRLDRQRRRAANTQLYPTPGKAARHGRSPLGRRGACCWRGRAALRCLRALPPAAATRSYRPGKRHHSPTLPAHFRRRGTRRLAR